jgi:hypothetical protein
MIDRHATKGSNAPMGLPAVRPRPWYVKEKWPAWVGLLLGGSASGSLILKEASAKPTTCWGLVAAFVACASVIGLGLLKLIQSSYKDAKTDQLDSPAELRGALHVLHKVVAGHKGTELSKNQLRITLYRVDGENLEQSVKYVGWEDDKLSVGRVLPVRSGLIGLVARTKETRTIHRPEGMSYEDWVAYLVRDLGMTEKSAKDTRMDRYSFLGIPIMSHAGVVNAVVYLDAAEKEFFDEDTARWCVSGCEGLALWIRERYYREEGLV